jgi:hypothetical protein
MLRKYWFMYFLGFVLIVSVFALLVPSWEREAERLVGIAFTALFLWYLVDRLDRIESKLDAVLKKSSE